MSSEFCKIVISYVPLQDVKLHHIIKRETMIKMRAYTRISRIKAGPLVVVNCNTSDDLPPIH